GPAMNASGPPAAASGTTPAGIATRLVRNSLYSASGRIVAMLAWFVVTPPLVKELGADGYGVWSLFYALQGWLGSLELCFAQVALRFGAAARARNEAAVAGEYATLAVLGYAGLALVWFALVWLLREPALDLLRIHGAARTMASQAFLIGALVFLVSGL